MTQQHTTIAYRPEVDGLRAIAVVSVILFHAGVQWLSGGYVGVDVFFVISGYLITSIILREKQAGTFSIIRFYERRARRILPALFVVLLACIPVAWYLMVPTRLESFAQSLIAVCVFASNILFWRTNDYFDVVAEEKPLLHTWSLGVEEQYYVLFPLCIVLFWKLGSKKIAAAIALAAIVSLGLSEWSASHGMSAANFFLTPTRAWELLLGSLVAFACIDRPLWERVPARTSSALSLAGLVLIAVPVFAYDSSTPFPGITAVAPTAGAALILAFARASSLTGRILSTKGMVGIGLISYSAYLWHQPLFAFARLASPSPPGLAVFGALSLLTLALAWLTWRFVETPFRSRQKFSRGTIFAGGALGTLFIVAAAATALHLKGFQANYYDRLSPQNKVIYRNLQTAIDSGGYSAMFDDGACRFWGERISDALAARYRNCFERLGPAIVVLGDSHAMDLYNAFASLMPDRFVMGISRGGCSPETPGDPCSFAASLHFIETNADTVKAILYTRSGGQFLKRQVSLPINTRFVEQTETYVSQLARHAPVLWLGPQPELLEDVRTVNLLRGKLDAHFKKEIPTLDAFFAARSTGKPYRYLSKIQLIRFSPGDFYRDGKFNYSDSDHWSTSGEKLFGSRMLADRDIQMVIGPAPGHPLSTDASEVHIR